jgi:hypothetical protein
MGQLSAIVAACPGPVLGTRNHISIVAVTAHAALSDRDNRLDTHGDSFHGKPANRWTRLRSIRQLLEKERRKGRP